MTTDFALNLSSSGISLLRRADRGWRVAGEAQLDGDLDAEMRALRAMTDDGAAVKLVLPEDQIKFLSLEDPGTPSGRAEAARAVLDGATPYPIDELSHDYAVKKGRLFVAAVARETLEEAEQFALAQGFRPVCFVGLPMPRKFNGEIFFGACDSWDGEAPSRETPPIRVMTDEEAQAMAARAAKEAARKATPAPAAQPQTAEASPAPAPADVQASRVPEPATAEPPSATATRRAAPAPTPPPAEPAPAAQARKTAQAQPAPSAPAAPQVQTTPETPARETPAPPPEPEHTVRPLPAEPAPDPDTSPARTPQAPEVPSPNTAASEPAPVPTFSSIRARRDVPPPTAAPRVDGPEGPADGSDAGPLNRPVPRRPNPDEVQARLRTIAATAPSKSDVPPPPAQAPAAGRGARGILGRLKPGQEEAAGPAAAQPSTPHTTPKVATQPKPAVSMEKPPAAVAPEAPSAPERIAALRPGREPPTTRAPAQDNAGGGAAVLTAGTDDEAQRMTIFGARQRAEQERIGGKPRYLGLLLTVVLLIFLAGVAAWASVFLEDGLARFFRSDSDEAQVAQLPDPAATETSASGTGSGPDAQPQESPDTRVAALEPGTAAEPPDAETPAALSEPETARALDPAEAEATYAATGIWQRAPTAPLALSPGQEGVGDPYMLSLDAGVEAHDAVALPEAEAGYNDTPFDAPMPPAPADTVFDLDERGFVVATPEGALNPDRIRVFAGMPPVVPPSRSSVLPGGQDAPATAAEAEALKRLNSVRPRSRPVTLVEDNERAALGGVSLGELAALRPNVRPESAKAEAETDTAATDQAVAESRAPIARPRNFASIVEQARERQEQQPQQVAAAPRTVEPSAPSSASVTQQATVRNALNLRRVNLIGVYGQPSNRRALVRLSNGRYQKVQVGDRIDGGRVAAIGESELRYVKGGRNVTLEMP
ncbi:hypothetical protein [Roseivivax sediminis]|uniref:Type IV pilus biogenesis protein PilP n=1 Tax=Roseivivax sediminis TaxID=936889 RepID=A0A1I1SEI2_9RHOB|nr:hypothetical protein [Roseivivax sediminis]SFD44861.1 hypothetical protein SAMN04515678_101127 [Roseivivax sediminis]